MEWIMFLFGIIVLILGAVVIYNAHQEKKNKDSKGKEEK